VQTYGNIDALTQLLDDSVLDDTEIDLALACPVSEVLVRDNDPLTNINALRDLGGAIVATLSASGDYDPDDYSPEDYLS
jgi:hypothetical protein